MDEPLTTRPARSPGSADSACRRFVILHHRLHDGEHWDLMLESGTALATWQLPRRPDDPDGLPLPARRRPDHRRAYLDFEGPVSGDRGHVTRFDEGTCRILLRTADRWHFELTGRVLTGRFRLTRRRDKPPDGWCLAAG